MKNGKLFGKLNIIDILVLLVLIVAIGLFAFWMLRPSAEETLGNEIQVSEPNLKFSVVCDDVSPELAENINAIILAGDRDFEGTTISSGRIYNNGKLMDAEITGCTVIKTGKEDQVQIRFDVEACAELKSGAYAVGWQELRLGKTYTVKTIDMELEGYVVSMEKIS